MKRALFISLLLHVCASAAAQNIEVRGDPAETTQIVLDSLATGIDGLPPMPASITYPDIPPFNPIGIPGLGLGAGAGSIGIPGSTAGVAAGAGSIGGNFLHENSPFTIPRPAGFEFVMPDRDLFLSYDQFRRQEGIVIPTGSVNSSGMILDNSGYMPLVRRGDHAFGLTGVRQRFPSMGFSNSLAAGYIWAPSDGITLYGNLRVSDNMYHLTRFRDFNVSGRARMRVADGVWLNGYGSYSILNGAGGQPMPPGMYPTNSFGGTLEVRITDGFGLEGGVMREYDPARRQWVTNPYFRPVFY